MRVLALALGVPFPPIGGGLTRTFHLLEALAAHHDVTLAAFEYGELHERPPYPLRVETAPWEWSAAYRAMTGADADAARHAYEHLTFEHDAPWFASAVEPTAMEAMIRRLLDRRPDVVLLEGTPLARFLPVLPQTIPCVLDFFDVHSVMTNQVLDELPDGERAAAAREAARTLAFERRAVERCAACLAVSREDAEAVRQVLGGSRVYLVPNGVDTSYFAHDPEAGAPRSSAAIVFTGRMSYEPNADAAAYFATDVFPLVRARVPDAIFHIVGTNPPPRVRALASTSVIVHGRVDDVRPHLWSSNVVVVPMRAGGGTRLKVLEAAAAGRAIVTTTLGIQGLAFHTTQDVLVADSPEAMATGVVDLLRDVDLQIAYGRRARAVAARYDWGAIGSSFRTIVEGIAKTIQ